MDRTAPAILTLDLNHVPGTAAAAFSIDVRSADQISADGRFPSAGKVALPSRRSADAAHIPCFTVEEDHGADRLHGGRDRSAIYFATRPCG
jgi:hypothetical protein